MIAKFKPNKLTLNGCRILLIFSIMSEDAAPQPTLNAANPYAFENVLITIIFLNEFNHFFNGIISFAGKYSSYA